MPLVAHLSKEDYHLSQLFMHDFFEPNPWNSIFFLAGDCIELINEINWGRFSVNLSWGQCWGKLLLKVMHYNIVLLPKNVTNYIVFMVSNTLRYFCVTFSHLGWDCSFVFNTKMFYFWQMQKPFHSLNDKPFSCPAILGCTKNRTQKNVHSSAIIKYRIFV